MDAESDTRHNEDKTNQSKEIVSDAGTHQQLLSLPADDTKLPRGLVKLYKKVRQRGFSAGRPGCQERHRLRQYDLYPKVQLETKQRLARNARAEAKRQRDELVAILRHIAAAQTARPT